MLLQLPTDAVREKKKELAAATTNSADPVLADQVYAHTLRIVRSPVAGLAHGVLPECRRLRRHLKGLILVNWITFALVPVSAVCAAIWSYWVLLATVSLGLLWYFAINRFQTATNLDLGARIEVFCEMVATDAGFRKRAEEALNAMYGCDVSDLFSYLSDAEPGVGDERE